MLHPKNEHFGHENVHHKKKMQRLQAICTLYNVYCTMYIMLNIEEKGNIKLHG